jgi:hypothetical protein
VCCVQKFKRFLLADLDDDGDDLSEHDNSVTLHDGDTSETLAILEGVDDKGLLGLEGDLSHFVGLEVDGVFHLLVSGFLSEFPLDLGHLEGGATSADESDRGVSDLELSRVVEDLDLGGEGSDTVDGGVRLEDHDVTNTGHVLLDETLDVETDVVTSLGGWDGLVVHLNGEDLSDARGGGGVGGEEDNFVSWLDDTLFDTSSDDVSNSLDLVDSGDGDTHGSGGDARGDLDLVLEDVKEGIDVNLNSVEFLDVHSGPPGHLLGFLDEVVSHPPGNGHDRDALLNKVLLPSDLDEHLPHLVPDFLVTRLSVVGDVAIHLVYTDDELLDTEQVDEDGVLAGLSLNFSGLVVSTSNGGGEVTVSRNHQKGYVCLRGTGQHVLDEVTMSRGIDDSVVLCWGEEFLCCAGDCDTTFTLFLLAVHVEGEGERGLSKTISLFTELYHFTLRDTTEFEDEASSGGRFASIDVTANDN